MLITYYNGGGHTTEVDRQIAHGAEDEGLTMVPKRVEEHTLTDLEEADGIAMGSPTYSSNMAWQVKKLIDECIQVYRQERRL